jgi:hypothetical protein
MKNTLMPDPKQSALKPQDLAVLLKLCSLEAPMTYSQLSAELDLAASQIHSSVRRLGSARLVNLSMGLEVIRPAVREFVLHGAKYCFPMVTGPATRGIPTSYAAPPLKDLLIQTEDLPPVWPHPEGQLRGLSFSPLYPTAPGAALKHREYYELLALFDALRSGAARERELSAKLLSERL